MKVGMRAPALAALSHDLMAAVDAEGRILWANAAWRRVLGWAPDAIAGLRLADLVHPDDAHLVGPASEAAVRLRTHSGRHHQMAVAAVAEDGVLYVRARDATQAVELEQELRAADDRFRSVTESTAEGILTMDVRGRITFANTATSAIFGWQTHELLGQPVTMLFPERFRGLAPVELAESLIGRTVPAVGLRRDGTEVPLEVSLGSYERGGRRAYTGILRDVSARRETERELELWGARYRALVANLPNVIVTLFDTDMRVLVMEGGEVARGTIDQSAFEGRPFEETVEPATFATVAPRVRAALAGEPQSFEYEPAGTDSCYEIHTVPLRGDDGGVIGAIAVGRDVTALRRALRASAERALELERSNAELAEFAYVASHDLSEPLRMISSYLQLLRRRHGERLDGEAGEFVDRAVEGATRMRALIEDLLAYSRAGRSDEPSELVDMNALVASIETEAGVVEHEDLPTVRGHALQLTQLLQNLISNGVKFVAPGTEPRVRVSAERDGDCWRFMVDDNGIGIEPRHAERIFGMFQRLHTREAFEGTGIGLAIARKVVERHGGRIWAEPLPHGGTRMAFTLPA